MKRILVTGALGMVGKELVEILTQREKSCVIHQADLKLGNDLRNFEECLRITKDIDEVYHLVGVKGSPKKTIEKPVDFMETMLQCDINMITAAQKNGVKKFLYTSSIAVLNPRTDKYPAWAKRTAEVLIEAHRIQYPKGTQFVTVRPCNVYGRFDDFHNPDAMVVTSLIRKALTQDKIEVWGNGTEIRDFINSKDVAEAMILCIEKMPQEPMNITGGKPHQIKQLAEYISRYTNKPVVYNKSKRRGAKMRIMENNLEELGFKQKIYLSEGIKQVIDHARTVI